VSDAKNPEKLLKPLPDIDTKKGRLEVYERASKGDKSVEPLVRKIFDRDQQNGGDLLNICGDMFAQACSEYVKRVVGNDIVYREGMLRKIAAVRDELAGPTPTSLERILCERIALCWFDANDLDRVYVRQTDLTFRDAEYFESRRDRAHKRFLAACKTLATIRRLGVPAIQVNVGNQQVNVASST
jgi:hypothetical protein